MPPFSGSATGSVAATPSVPRPVPPSARPVRTAVGLLSAALLVAGCGTVGADAGAGASPVPAAPCGYPPATGTAAREGWVRDGVRILSVALSCAEFEVDNPGSAPIDVSVLFRWTPVDGRPDLGPTATVTAVPPGGTARGRVEVVADGLSATGRPMVVPDARIVRVRSVPTAEAPAESGPCPAAGVRLFADRGDAAMGLRVVGLHLVNCGTAPVTLDGYPQVQPLDEAHRALDGVRVLEGGAAIAGGTGADAPPRRFTVRPGQGAGSALVWRNTVDLGAEPVNAPYVRVRATADGPAVTVTPELDLGTTGRLGVGAWAPEPIGS